MKLFECYTAAENRLYAAMGLAWCEVEYSRLTRDRDMRLHMLRSGVAPRCRQLVEGERQPTIDGDFAALELRAAHCMEENVMLLSTNFDSHPDAPRLCRRGVITDSGRRVTFAEFQRACAEARARGWQVFPHEGCVRIGPDGHCADPDGCEAERALGGGI